MLNSRNVFLALAALTFLLLAVALEHPFFHIPGPNWRSIVFSGESLVGLSRELAFALIIALIVSIGIEKEAREADQRRADRLRRDIAADVFSGVFSRRLPKSLVDQVIATHLSATIIRVNAHIHFILERVNEKEAEQLGFDPSGFVQLRTKFHFTLKNISGRRIDETQRFQLPRRPGAPGRYGQLLSIRSGLNSETLADQETFAGAEARARKEFLWSLALDPDETRDFAIEAVVAKDISDNEVWGSFHPTMAVDISLTNKIPSLRVGLVGRTSTALREIYREADSTSARWQVEGAMLANESLTLWWTNRI
jgi:hypothetical protein